MNVDGKSTRFYERKKIHIPLQASYRETADYEWTESTQTEDVTICGAGFTLSRPVEPNRLIRLELPMPKKFRLFDFGQDLYEIWALIRYLRVVESNIANQIHLMIGVAFIGEYPPPGFLQNPKTLYDLKPILQDKSLWDLHELPRNTGPYVRSTEERRPISIKVILGIINQYGQIIESAEAETLNISESGMALITKLTTDCQKFVQIENTGENAALLAAVRGVFSLEATDSVRLHLEFISGKWRF